MDGRLRRSQSRSGRGGKEGKKKKHFPDPQREFNTGRSARSPDIVLNELFPYHAAPRK